MIGDRGAPPRSALLPQPWPDFGRSGTGRTGLNGALRCGRLGRRDRSCAQRGDAAGQGAGGSGGSAHGCGPRAVRAPGE